MRHWVGPYQKSYREDNPTLHIGWQPPPQSIAAVDLRTLADQSVLSQGPQSNRGWFCTQDNIALPSEYEEVLPGRESILCSILGIDVRNMRSSGEQPILFLFESLNEHTDPDGSTGPKPIMPTRRGSLDLVLGRRVRSIRFNLSRDLKQRDVFQRNYASLRARDEILARKWLGFQKNKLGFDDTQIKQLQPLIYRNETPLPPETTHNETFTVGDKTSDIDADHTWTYEDSSWAISSNQCKVYNGTGGGSHVVRCESAVSGDDHIVSIVYNSVTPDGDYATVGPAARMGVGGASANCYCVYLSVFAVPWKLFKLVGGGSTSLYDVWTATLTLPMTIKISCNGSTIEAWIVGQEADKASVTDTSYSGQLLGGIYGYNYFGRESLLDTWTFSDIVTPPTAPSGLTATVNSPSQIDLSWTDNSDNEDNFEIERSLDGSTGWTQIATPTANTTSYSDTGLNASTTYYYRILATNGGGDSAWSSTANATTGAYLDGSIVLSSSYSVSSNFGIVFDGTTSFSSTFVLSCNASIISSVSSDVVAKIISANDMGRVGVCIATGPFSYRMIRDNESNPGNIDVLSSKLSTKFDDINYYKLPASG